MSKRKQKQRDEQFGAIALLLSFFTWYVTQSVIVGVITFVAASALILIIMRQLDVARQTQLRASGMAEIDKMGGLEFEHYLAALFRDQGYKVEVTAASGDYGADLILRRQQQVIVVQAKRYAKAVGVRAVQEVTAAVKHYKATDAWIVTNNTFTPQAVKLAQSNDVKLIDRGQLIRLKKAK